MAKTQSSISDNPSLLNVPENFKEEAKKKNLNIEFRVGDMINLPYDSNSFDAVICM